MQASRYRLSRSHRVAQQPRHVKSCLSQSQCESRPEMPTIGRRRAGAWPGRGARSSAPPPYRTRSLARDACMLARLGYHYHLAHHLPAIEAASRPHLTLTVSLHWGGGAGRGPRGVRTTVNIMETNLSPAFAFGRGCSIL